jgi:hypothetical protein
LFSDSRIKLELSNFDIWRPLDRYKPQTEGQRVQGSRNAILRVFEQMLHGMMAAMESKFITITPSGCKHGNPHSTKHCNVANLFMTAYEDALNMIDKVLCSEEHITKDMAPSIASSPLEIKRL